MRQLHELLPMMQNTEHAIVLTAEEARLLAGNHEVTHKDRLYWRDMNALNWQRFEKVRDDNAILRQDLKVSRYNLIWSMTVGAILLFALIILTITI